MKRQALNTFLFSATLFLSAALMFGLQPMIGKMLLPRAGGTPSAWIVAMAFFQIMLLAGYFLAHALSKLPARRHGILYIVALGCGLIFLPPVIREATPTPGGVFAALFCAVALPFAALSATSSTIQRLYATKAKDPYFLYAASNLGSFAGLLLYPFIVEPNLGLAAQAKIWCGGYAALMLAAAFCTSLAGADKTQKTKPATRAQRLEWIILSFFPSATLLAVTTNITTDIFSAPLLWVLPLSLYLLTFVVAFAQKKVASYDFILKIQPPLAAAALGVAVIIMRPIALSWSAVALHLAAFTSIALMCHMRLARTRPDASRLTEFYLMISIGGALGGIACAFIAPAVFNTLAEYPFLLALSSLLNENIRKRIARPHLQGVITACALMIALSILHQQGQTTPIMINLFLLASFALLTLHPRLSLIATLLLTGATYLHIWKENPIMTERNFFGVVKVFDKDGVRYMQHGTTLHGLQYLDAKRARMPLAYYTPQGPLGQAIEALQPKNIAVVGLGAGAINMYAAPGRYISFYEIDPAVVRMAEEKFTYLSHRPPRIIIGDARLELEREKEKFDLIILDAFSSDMVPTHLLTTEALQIYLDRLSPNGSLLFHISNRYFDLSKPLAAEAKELRLHNYLLYHKIELPGTPGQSSRWMILSAKPQHLKGWQAAEAGTPWTDDYTNLLGTLIIGGAHAKTH